jgi:hypothetical protein
MEKTKKEQAEKLQSKLDKLIQSRNKKQAAFDNLKKEIADLNKNIDSVKLKLFEILQSGSDDTVFSEWAKRKINESENSENGKSEKRENGKIENHENSKSENRENGKTINHENAKAENPNSAKPQNGATPSTQNQLSHAGQNARANATQNHS